jgi:Cu+-exporting ATPase
MTRTIRSTTENEAEREARQRAQLPDVTQGTPNDAEPEACELITITVSGMTCAACQARVQRTLAKQPGVADASVNLMMQSASVKYDPSVVTPEDLVQAIRKTGYGAELA